MTSERGLAYDVFGPLWGVVELAAVAASGSLRDASLVDFVADRRGEVDGILESVRAVGDFSGDAMSVFERQGGWNEGREVTAEYLLMYSGCVENYPPNADDPAVLRRVVRMGGDLQLTALTDALVGTATVRGPGLAEAPALIVGAVGGAGVLLGRDGEQSVRDAFRMWRVAHLPSVLWPDSPTPAQAKKKLRAYAHALEALVLDG